MSRVTTPNPRPQWFSQAGNRPHTPPPTPHRYTMVHGGNSPQEALFHGVVLGVIIGVPVAILSSTYLGVKKLFRWGHHRNVNHYLRTGRRAPMWREPDWARHYRRRIRLASDTIEQITHLMLTGLGALTGFRIGRTISRRGKLDKTSGTVVEASTTASGAITGYQLGQILKPTARERLEHWMLRKIRFR